MKGLGIVTVTHSSAPLDVLEQVSYVGDDITARLEVLRAQIGLREATILSTCNRTEIYAIFDGAVDASRLGWFLAQDRHICWGRLRDHVTLHSGDDAVAHLFRVASGVDSLAFGEAEIVGQVKAVHAELRASGQHELMGLFEAAIRTSRTVRRQIDVSQGGASLGTAAVTAARLGERDRPAKVLLVGAGKIARSVLASLPDETHLVVTSRTHASAQGLAGDRGRAVPIEDFAEELARADAVFFCASSRSPILGADVATSLTAERSAPLVAVDLGLPRNVAAEVAGVDGIEVIDLDGLRSHTTSLQHKRTLSGAEAIIADRVARHREATLSRGAAPLIEDLRSSLEALSEAELARAFPASGSERQRSAAIVRRVVGRVLHNAIAEVRRVAVDGDEQALASLARAFGSRAATDPAPSTQPSNKEDVA